ncbi:hypothetical protein MgSA37_03814 [Mucilaginibacter gotjawali]|uniref:Uncharacterized protein n=1 Tax=Mucilaginibacter gotjawali TaxID=1550579 RepID=A0A0X8X5U0_9SPHI|nr:hypothetical protein [Mucilaginibacter gotjawali]BAU55623.1 hypothetical protein MgSA37_03814 [Mucilaginibacter gotjawali]
MKNKFLVAGIIVLGICFSSCKTKNKPSDNIDLGISNNSLNNEQIDVEIFTNGKQFFKKKLIKSFYFEKHRLRPGNYLLKISIKIEIYPTRTMLQLKKINHI